MSEFARYLLAAGMTSSRFTGIARIAFYKAASACARFHNNRLNQSAVAAMTGLTRVQVRGFSLQDKAESPAKPNLIERIVEGWTTDPHFLTSNYVPKKLGIGYRNAPFNALVRQYGGDVPARSALRELVRTGCVTVRDQFVALNPRIRRTTAQERLQHISRSLVELLRESSQGSQSKRPLRTMNGEVFYQATSPKGRILMQRRIAKSLDALLAELKAAGDATSIESPPISSQSGWITRTRVVLISEELNTEDGG